jgi:TonB family protein
MPRRPSVLLLSIFVHAIVLMLIAAADLWRPITDWPMPRELFAFEAPRVVRLDDVPLPPQGHRTTHQQASTEPARRTEAAPIAAPPGLAPDIERPESTLIALGGPDQLDKLFGGPGGGVVPQPALPQAPEPQPKTLVRPQHSGIRPPQRLVNVAPIYPTIALQVHKDGIVIIDATIDEQGNVIATRVLRSIPLLDEAAETAVRQWKFSPTLLNGVPVPIVMTVTVNFKLTQ